MMKYNPAYVHFEYTDSLIDKWCVAADSIYEIKATLLAEDDYIKGQLVQIKMVDNNISFPFSTTSDNSYEMYPYKFVYVDPEFQIMKREIYVGIDPGFGLTYSINNNKFKHIYYTTSGIEDAKEWITKRIKFEDLMKAWENGAEIQKRESISDAWDDVVTVPRWDFNADYRVKPNEEVLKWTDLKIGDVIRSKVNQNVFMQVQGIDKSEYASEHISAGGDWKSDDELKDWEKVEE